jgi:hypothetical protein
VYYFGTTVESEVSAAARSTGKHDTEKMQMGRARIRLSRMLGLEPEFADMSKLIEKRKKKDA